MAFRVEKGCAAFGEICGYAPGNIPCFSNGSDWHFSGDYNVVDGVHTGFKYQCVEFARRWLLQRKGLWLPDVAWAAHIFSMKNLFDAATAEPVPVKAIPNGKEFKPEADAILIYPSQADFPPGHVAAIVEVGDGYARIADQNNRFEIWPAGQHWSEQLTVTECEGTYTLKDAAGRVPIGWLVFPGRANRPDDAKPPHIHESFRDKKAHPLELKRITFTPKPPKPEDADKAWLDVSQPEIKKFVDTFGMDTNRSRLDESEANYYTMNIDLWFACTRAGTSLHRLALAATEKVLNSEDDLRTFGIPEKHWERIRRSWKTQPYAISGRFDFVVDADGTQLKTFEYNADSASTLLECAVIQEAWAQHVGVAEKSFSSGRRIESLLEHAWSEAIKGGVIAAGSKLHLLVDNDNEEQYTALFVAKCAQRAGLTTEVLVMFDGLEWRGGKVVDKSSGQPVKTVWKTWAWETALDDERAAEQERPNDWAPQDGDKVRLCDVLLGDESIHVFEPMWKIVTSNKALLPLMWEMAPNHPNMLRAEWHVSDHLRATGYAKKPIVGRCGLNVTVHGPGGEPLAQSEGKFATREMVYQELFQLPKRDDYFAILGGWMIGPHYGGTGLREDKGIITNVESPFSAIRIMLPFEPTPVTAENAHEDPVERVTAK